MNISKTDEVELRKQRIGEEDYVKKHINEEQEGGKRKD